MTSKNRTRTKPVTTARMRATFSFIDLEGFTAHTEAHGDEEAADLATRFADLTRSVLGTEPIAEAARACGIPVAELGSVHLKNVRGTIPLFS